MIARLDIEPSQVFVDVKFVTTLNTELLDLGVDYGDGGPTVTISGGAIPITLPFGLGSSGWEDGIIANPSGSGPFADPAQNAGNTIIPDTVFGRLSFTGVAATLKMLQRDTKSDVVQAPKIIALDGQEATIFVGETIRYAEAKSEQGQAGGLQLSLTEAQGSPVDVGFQLMVVPHVIPGTNNLTMEVIPKETSLSGDSGQSALSPAGFDVFTVGASGLEGTIALPRTRTSTIVTTMLLESGQTAVIGGLTTESDQKLESRVPYISAIPVLGELFKYKSKARQRRSLLVFVTPTIVHSAQEQEAILQREFAKRRVRLKDQVEALVGTPLVAEPTEGQ
jgi:general secretion pathway protein D